MYANVCCAIDPLSQELGQLHHIAIVYVRVTPYTHYNPIRKLVYPTGYFRTFSHVCILWVPHSAPLTLLLSPVRSLCCKCQVTGQKDKWLSRAAEPTSVSIVNKINRFAAQLMAAKCSYAAAALSLSCWVTFVCRKQTVGHNVSRGQNTWARAKSVLCAYLWYPPSSIKNRVFDSMISPASVAFGLCHWMQKAAKINWRVIFNFSNDFHYAHSQSHTRTLQIDKKKCTLISN